MLYARQSAFYCDSQHSEAKEPTYSDKLRASGVYGRAGAISMIDDRIVKRKKMREELAELKNAAITELERRGYEVRGKTPAQIRQILKRRPAKQNAALK